MKDLEIPYVEFSQDYGVVKDGYKGDLYEMLFPDKGATDEQVDIRTEYDFYYISNFRNADDLVIQTMNEESTGNLIMWRDSFGILVYPYFAESFYEAEFRREIPYNFTNIGEKDVAIIEIVERNIPWLLDYLPVIEASEVTVETDKEKEVCPEIYVRSVSGYYLLEALVPEIPEKCINVYFRIADGDSQVIYEAYPSAEKGDASIYLEELPKEAEISIIYEYNGETYETLKKTINCV